MRIDISFKHLESSTILDNIIEKNISRIERHTKIFKPNDVVHVSFHMEKNPHKDDYFCWINMYLPFRVFKAQSRDKTPSIAINNCFAALLKQLDKARHKLEDRSRKNRLSYRLAGNELEE